MKISHSLKQLHPDATAFGAKFSSCYEDFKIASEALSTKIAKTKRITQDSRKFAVDRELIVRSIVLKINGRILKEAVEEGNIVSREMPQPKHVFTDKAASYDEWFMVILSFFNF